MHTSSTPAFFAVLDVLWAEKAPIGTVEFCCFSEGLLVTLHRVFNVDIVRGISFERPILVINPRALSAIWTL